MAIFNYTAIDNTNKVVKGKVEADDLRAARAAVRELGFTPTNLAEEQSTKKKLKKQRQAKCQNLA